ncbi:battenin-like isoform X2 [Patiria miniata]|uniref:Battenin n=1 Tax=Patiria miniata TaxID=46514 RepID=A0A914AT08_PATMI|nr:battenin-like isoform X2 [Patiria miniata]
MDTVTQPLKPADQKNNKRAKMRNLVAFWLLGLCNNCSFYVMLSAAYDILKGGLPETVVLLADILPQLIVDLAGPWFADYIPYDFRVAVCVLTATSSFLLVAFIGVRVVSVALTGVALAGLSTGLGEFTYLSLSSFYDKNAVSTWSSGTGASGLVSSLTYAGLTEVLAPKNALLVMLVVPALMIISYWGILVKVPVKRPILHDAKHEEKQRLLENGNTEGAKEEMKTTTRQHLTLKERLHHFKYLLKYILPLMFVYIAQYFTNQGLLELIYFRGTFLTHDSQYRWLQVLFRLGAFISRSSVNIVRVERLWIFSILEWCVLVLVFTEVYFTYMPSIAIVFVIVLLEGLVAGSAYVNTFYQIRVKESPKYKEFAMGTTILALTIGTSLAGVLAVPVHNALCQQ